MIAFVAERNVRGYRSVEIQMKAVRTVLVLTVLLWGCAHGPEAGSIHEAIHAHGHVDDFVVWLREQPGIKDVTVNKSLFLTSSPPKVVVTYLQHGQKSTLLIAVEPDQKLRLVTPK